MNESAPRVFLDARDMINCLDKGVPVGANKLGEALRHAEGKLVIASLTLSELVPGRGTSSASEAAAGIELIKKLARVPHCFIRSVTITVREFREAYDAWQERREIRAINPYVDHWFKTLWRPAQGTTDLILEGDDTRLLSELRTWQQVEFLAQSPEMLRWQEKHIANMKISIERLRARYGSRRDVFELLKSELKRHVLAAGWYVEPRRGLDTFARHVKNNPEWCPGWRMQFDALEEHRANVSSRPRPGDLQDLSQIPLLPYVTHLTMDAYWRDCLNRARLRRETQKLRAPYFDRIHRDIGAVLDTF